MVCRNCNSLMRDGLANCPKCGAAVEEQSSGYDPFASNAPAPSGDFSGPPADGGYINIGGRYYRLGIHMVLPAVMAIFIIIGMFGAFSFKTASIKVKVSYGGYSATSDSVKYKLSDCADADLRFSKIANAVCILCDVAAAAGLVFAGYTLMKTHNGIDGLRAMVIPTTSMLISFIFVIINGFYVRREANLLFGYGDAIKAKGGPSFVAWFLLAVFIASTAACRKLADDLEARKLAGYGNR